MAQRTGRGLAAGARGGASFFAAIWYGFRIPGRYMSLDDTPISRYMSPCPHTIEQDESMDQAHRLMRDKRVRHLPVLRKGHLVGVVSAGDLRLLETLDGVDPDQVQVEEAMTPEPYCVTPDTLLEPVVAAMAANKYGCALVVQNDEVVGIFTTVDALIAFSETLRSR